jgi:hypothetical protein
VAGSGAFSITLDKGVLLLTGNDTADLNSIILGNGIASVIEGGGMSTEDSDAMKAQYSDSLTNDGNLWWGYDSLANKTAFWGEGTAVDGYAGWADDWGADLGASTDDYDGDGVANIYEYGLGGNPTNAASTGTPVTYQIENGDLVYAYPQLAADQNSGLTYSLETRASLIDGDWNNTGYVVVSTNVTGSTFDIVTNAVDMTESEGFVRLVIE